MFNANLEVHTHNEYYLKLINTKTNTVENYTAKNYFCLPALSSCLFYPLDNTEVSSKGIVGISVYKKVYNGNVIDDTKMYKTCYTMRFGYDYFKRGGFQGTANVSSKLLNDTTIMSELTITFPATSDYVVSADTVSIVNHYWESGSYGASPMILTVGAIKDSEGNNTTLNKTADDILIVTAKIYFQINKENLVKDEETGFMPYNNINEINPIFNSFYISTTTSKRLSPFREPKNYGTSNLYISNTKYRVQSDRMLYNQCGSYSGINNKYIKLGCNYLGSTYTNSSDSYAKEYGWWEFTDEDKSGIYHVGKYGNSSSNISEFSKDSFNGHYLTYLVISGLGYFELPNEKIFPKYTLTDIPIQSTNEHPIDGVNKEFKHPLSYFVKDSEIIKVNGTALTRGTDYTVDSYNNQDMLPELMWNCFVCEREGRVFWDISHKATTCAIRWFDTLCRYNAYDGTSFSKYSTWEGNHEDYWDNKIADTITSLKPLILTLDKEYTINYLRMPGFAVYKFNDLENTIDSNWTAYSCDYCTIFEYSLDKTTWTEFHRVKSLNYDVEGSHSEITTDFEKYLDTPITAKYIRIRLEFTNEFKPADNNEIFVLSDSSNTKLNPNMSDSVYHCGTIGYVGGNIKFTEAPPEDATITFTCDCDLPYKTDQYKLYLDCSVAVTFKQGNVAPIEEITSEG